MGLKTPQHYVESLRDGRVTYWDGERIDDITTHPRFRVPIALTAVDYEYDAPDYGALRRYRTEEGERGASHLPGADAARPTSRPGSSCCSTPRSARRCRASTWR